MAGFQLVVVVAIWSPATGALLYQSAMAMLNCSVLPSVWVMVPVPLAAPNAPAPRKPRSVPDPDRSTVCVGPRAVVRPQAGGGQAAVDQAGRMKRSVLSSAR
jgi:hypothetical protein